MSKHQVQRLGDEYVVVDDKQAILHKFPSQGEAELQVVALAEAEKAEKAEAKDEAKEAKAHKNDDDEGKSHARSESSAGGRHR